MHVVCLSNALTVGNDHVLFYCHREICEREKGSKVTSRTTRSAGTTYAYEYLLKCRYLHSESVIRWQLVCAVK